MTTALIVPCSACGALNRVPSSRLNDVPVCADCREHLLGRAPHDIDARIFGRLVERSDLPVIVDFWAAWCGPCRAMAPAFEAAATQLSGHALLVKLDTEAQPDIAGRHDIRSIPTMIAFRHGKELARQSGALSTAQIVSWARALRV